MHNGVFANLEQVVDFYDRGGGSGIGIDLPNQTLPPDRLTLTPQEKQDLIAFMRARPTSQHELDSPTSHPPRTRPTE